MSRSPLAYPLTRGIDGDSGGAADLQTDIMRFMAILALCLVAIFALVQSLPIEPQTPPPQQVASEAPPVERVAEEIPIISPADSEMLAPEPPLTAATPSTPEPEPEPVVTLTRPKWVSTFQPQPRPAVPEPAPQQAEMQAPAEPLPPPVATAPSDEPEGFTLRFESDIALTRLVATGQVGFYAIDSDRAQRMTISESRISFWNASTPNEFHEMDASTVPRSVVDALARSGANAQGVNWGVTLPGKLSSQLNTLMTTHKGGSLVIRANGNLVRETG